jgi:hypothetical protein
MISVLLPIAGAKSPLALPTQKAVTRALHVNPSAKGSFFVTGAGDFPRPPPRTVAARPTAAGGNRCSYFSSRPSPRSSGI